MITATMDNTDTRNLAHLIRAIDGIHPGLYRAAGSLDSAAPPARAAGYNKCSDSPATCAVGARLRVRSRKFEGRCAKHKGNNPAVDGRGGIRGACARCELLFEIWEASLKLNQLIRKFDPGHDDLKRPSAPKPPASDP